MSGTPSPSKSATVGAPPAPLASATGPHRAWPRWSISQTLPAWTTTISGCGAPVDLGLGVGVEIRDGRRQPRPARQHAGPQQGAIAVVGRRAAQDLLACA